MKLKPIAAIMLCALFIAAPGCGTTGAVHKGPAHMHHRPGSNARKKIHRHSRPVRNTDSSKAAKPAADKQPCRPITTSEMP